ncbi:12269_t:CDS:2 [Racocetra fulgida]|uniref:12269_t:CDS:1 n=1 Tax=Racocetra fulgida TaxID=60492 RepID=A0A9N8WF18_9GLOM|nr:12269_t:CDS:2 [Racocetra fulgida]
MAQDSTDIKETIGALDDYVLLGRSGGNHRKSLVENIDASLKRLGTGYVDLLYVHIWEYRTPIEEVIRSLDDAVRSGKVLYAAISDTPAWVISRANTIAELRESVASARNTGDMRDMRNNSIMRLGSSETNWKILDEVTAIAAEINRTPAQVALNWVAQKPGVTSTLVGARTKAQLIENLKALEFKLDDVSASKDVPFPYSLTLNFEKYLGKGIQIPDKYKALFNASQKSEEKY